MNKFVVSILIFVVFFAFSSISQATLITNLSDYELENRIYDDSIDHLTSDLLGINYITHEGYDWAWVSPVNLEYSEGNTLYDAELQKNWEVADTGLLTILRNDLTLAHFTNAVSGEIIQAVQFFNSDFTHVDEGDFNSGFVSSELTESDSFMSGFWGGQETFYVRDLSAAPEAPKPIPEPLSIIIFATALIALQIKTKQKSA
jgi:hypothetical protein